MDEKELRQKLLAIFGCGRDFEYHSENEDVAEIYRDESDKIVEQIVAKLTSHNSKKYDKMEECLKWLISDKFDSRDMNQKVRKALQ
jgi:hypothetical protein